MSEPIFCTLLVQWPCAKGEVWAAWAQAVLSAAAIWYAGRFAKEQERVARKRSLDSIVAIFSIAEDAAHEALERAGRSIGEVLSGSPLAFQRMASTFAAMPLYQLPDPRLVWAVDQARKTCEELDQLFDARIGTDSKLTPRNFADAVQLRDMLVHCTNEAMGAANRAIVPIKITWRVRKFFQRKTRNELWFAE